MPRTPDDKNEAQQRRQRRYRRRLKSSGTPEASSVDVAVAASVAAYAEMVRRAEEDAREAVRERRQALREIMEDGVLSEHESNAAFAELMLPTEPVPLLSAPPRDFVKTVLRGAVRLLIDEGFDPSHSKHLVIRRLGRGGSTKRLDDIIDRSGVTLSQSRVPATSHGDGT